MDPKFGIESWFSNSQKRPFSQIDPIWEWNLFPFKIPWMDEMQYSIHFAIIYINRWNCVPVFTFRSDGVICVNFFTQKWMHNSLRFGKYFNRFSWDIAALIYWEHDIFYELYSNKDFNLKQYSLLNGIDNWVYLVGNGGRYGNTISGFSPGWLNAVYGWLIVISSSGSAELLRVDRWHMLGHTILHLCLHSSIGPSNTNSCAPHRSLHRIIMVRGSGAPVL